MVINKAIKSIQEFIKLESAGGILLFVFAIIALVLSNSPWQSLYTHLQDLPLTFQIGDFSLSKPLVHWVNDGLMAVFFLLVGLEIKREFLVGELNSLSKFALPGFAAVGGMLVPAIVYFLVNFNHPANLHGWAIPTATDIAFALGVLSLLGRRIPVSLKVFLTALAILDDLGAIVIIAIFYNHGLSTLSLVFASICVLILFIMNRARVVNLVAYCVVGVVLWVCVLKSGIHATLAGVVLAMAIPLKDKKDETHSPLKELEHSLNPLVAFIVLPIFAFFNAGVSFKGITFHTFLDPIPLGIALGLFIGKQIGVFGASWLAVKLRLARLPAGTSWCFIYGAALLCGIGFTMSLFIGTLAFTTVDSSYAALVRLGVIVGSLLSGLLGYIILSRCKQKSSIS